LKTKYFTIEQTVSNSPQRSALSFSHEGSKQKKSETPPSKITQLKNLQTSSYKLLKHRNFLEFSGLTGLSASTV